MALYNLSEFISTVKEDIGIKDLPLPITDDQLIDRFNRSALIDFSIFCPRIETFMVDDNNISKDSNNNTRHCYRYVIPKFIYMDTVVLGVPSFEPARPNGYSDFYTPNANWGSPDQIISAMGDVRMAAGLASSLTKAPTHIFRAPDIIEVYNGWANGVYNVEVLLKHDLSLASIQPSAFPDLRDLTVLDFKMYLYNELKRKDNLDVGIGNINLKIDDWSNAEADKKELLKTWREDGATLDFEHIHYF